jgi:WD40 repeat protein
MAAGLAGRLSRALVRCHPRCWRDRYGEEMLEVLDQHQPTARTVASLAASVLSTHADPAYRTDRLSLSRLRRGALISAVVAALLALVLVPIGYRIWQDGYWHPAADEGLAAVAFAPHSAILVTAFGVSLDGTDRVWDATNLSQPRLLSQFEGGQPTVLSPDGRTVATVTFGRRTALWNIASPRHPVRTATLPSTDGNTLWGLAFSPDGQVLATAYYDGIVLWDVTSPARPRLLRSLDASLTSPAEAVVGSGGETALGQQDIAFSPGGTILATVTGTDQIALWNVADPAHAYRLATLGAGDFVQAFAFSPGGNLLAAVTDDGTVQVYSLANPPRPARTATVRGLLARALYPNGTPQPAETPLCATCGPGNYAVAFGPGGRTLTVVVDREEMSANSGRDTIFDWPVTGSGALGPVMTTARDVADFQPFIAPGDRTVLGGPGSSHAWRAWPLP